MGLLSDRQQNLSSMKSSLFSDLHSICILALAALGHESPIQYPPAASVCPSHVFVGGYRFLPWPLLHGKASYPSPCLMVMCKVTTEAPSLLQRLLVLLLVSVSCLLTYCSANTAGLEGSELSTSRDAPFIFGECANLKHPPYFYQRVIFKVQVLACIREAGCGVEDDRRAQQRRMRRRRWRVRGGTAGACPLEGGDSQVFAQARVWMSRRFTEGDNNHHWPKWNPSVNIILLVVYILCAEREVGWNIEHLCLEGGHRLWDIRMIWMCSSEHRWPCCRRVPEVH
nr:uncharacterized protein LOC127292806 isoform X2 [Lolium perenne]